VKEFISIIDAFEKTDLSVQKAALATVVKVSGSSYRSPGARMLINDNGKWVGSISGGCLEGDALRKARQVMQSGNAITITYDTREESNQNLGIGLGCNGVIDVLIEPVNERHNPVAVFRELVEANKLCLLGTVFGGPHSRGERLVIDANGNAIRTIAHTPLNEKVATDLSGLLATLKTQSQKYQINGEEFEVFLELIQPNIRVMIFGAGFDARPVSQMAKMLGWEVAVTDECISHIAPVFFPNADKLSLCDRNFIDRNFDITPYTACILMSHNYEYDRDVLRKIIHSDSPYIGILGPRKRFEKMLNEFALEGLKLDDELNRIHAPIGLDIGAETPDEIALSIISEIKGRFSNRSGGFLKYRTGPIHVRDPRDGQIFREIFRQNDQSQAAS
jgi:xanthine dehydrogenase accessory factor